MELSSVRRVLLTHAHLFQRAYVYGSVAKGRADEHSDVDLILIRETALPFFDRVREVLDIVNELAPLDLLIYTEDEFQKLLGEPGRYFLKDIAETGVVIEGRQDRSSAVAAPGGE